MRYKETWDHFFSFWQICDGLQGEVSGYPFHYSCLGNSIDKGAWRARVRGAKKGRIWQSDQHFHKGLPEGRLPYTSREVLFRGKTLGKLDHLQMSTSLSLPLRLPPHPTPNTFPPCSHSLHSVHRMKFQVIAKFESCSCLLGPNTLHQAPS